MARKKKVPKTISEAVATVSPPRLPGTLEEETRRALSKREPNRKFKKPFPKHEIDGTAPQYPTRKPFRPVHIEAYTDGSYRPPHIGAWSYVLTKGEKVLKYDAKGVNHGTINQMELLGILHALKSIKTGFSVTVYSDSQYAVKSLSVWCHIWKKSGWRTGSGDPVKNKDLILEIEAEAKRLSFVKYVHVYGHRGNKFNEVCDVLAQGITYQNMRAYYDEKEKRERVETTESEPA